MECTYKYKGSSLTKKELIEVLSYDPEVVQQYAAQEERIGDDYEAEDISVFNKKAEALKRTMNVEVIFDDDVETSRLLSKSDPRTKAAGKPVILINPNSIFKTTAIHEFGHVFIDSFPKGISNPRIQKALKQLEGTQLEKDVIQMYPELSGDLLKKEILVTAIGREGSKIWESQEDMSNWDSFMLWFSDFLKRTFGLEKDAVKSLSRELLNDKVKEIDIAKLEDIDQQMKPLLLKRGKESEKTETDKSLSTIEEKVKNAYSIVLARVEKILLQQKDRVESSDTSKKIEKDNVKKGKTTRLTSIEKFKKELTEFDKQDKKKGIIKYLEWAQSELDMMSEKISEKERRSDEDSIAAAINWSSSFNIINDLQSLVSDIGKDNHYFSEEEMEVLNDKIIQIKGAQSTVDSKLLSYARDIFAERLADSDSETDERVKAQYRKEWKELEELKATNQTEGEYVISQLEANKKLIRDEKMRRAREQALRGTSSLGRTSMAILSEKDMKSKTIRTASNLLDRASHNIELFKTGEATEMDDGNKKFTENKEVEDSNSRDMRKKYKGMFVFSKSGQGYYTSEYVPEFLEESQKIHRESYDPEIYDEKFEETGITVDTYMSEDKDTKEPKKMYVAKYKSKVIGPKTGKNIEGTIKFSNASNIKVEGIESLKEGERPTHVTYTKKGYKNQEELVRISINEAIARSEAYHWGRVNTYTVNGKITPIKKWESQVYKDLKKDPVRFKLLQDFKKKVNESNSRYDNRNSLIESQFKIEYTRLQGMMKTSVSRIAEGQSLKTMGKAELSKLIQTQADEFDSESLESYTDFQNGETLKIPVSYRSKLKESDQSLDLHTMILMDAIMSKNHQEKRSIESALKIMAEVVKNKEYPIKDGLGRHKVDAQSKRKQYEIGNTDSTEYKKLVSLTENRLNSITSKQSAAVQVGEDGPVIESKKLVELGLRWFGANSLLFNFANSIVNAGSGTFSNLIEAIGGDVYNLEDYKKGKKAYARDLKDIMKDMGSNVQTSRTNMLMSFMNTMGMEYMNNEFEKGTTVEAMANMSTLRPFATMGEHMMQAQVMYSILYSIKVQNNSGGWIDKDGKPVKTKKEAASLADMIVIKRDANGRGTIDLNHHVKNTSFTTTGNPKDILLETRNLIRSKVDELHGQYTSDIQADAQRYVLGKVGFFLRKWMIPGYLRRYRGIGNFRKPLNADLDEDSIHYDPDQKANMEGYYVTSARFISGLIKDLRNQQFNLVNNWKELTPKQRGSIKKTMADVGFMASVSIAYALLEGGMEDDDEVFWYFVLRRQQSELQFFLDPTEAFKIAQTPTAAVGNIKQIMKTLNYMRPSMWGEEYKVGPYKGDSKLFHTVKKMFPRVKNSEDYKQSLEFLLNMSM